MRIPNPYDNKNYRSLIFIPLALLVLSAISLAFIKPLQYGIEFRGGILVNAYTSDANPDVEGVKRALAPFSSSVSVRPFDGPSGKGIEVELGNSESLDEAEQILKTIHENQRELSLLQLNVSRDTELAAQGDSDASNRLDAEKKRAETLSTLVLSDCKALLSKVGSSAQAPADTEKAAQLAEKEFGQVRQEYREKVLAAISSAVKVNEYSIKEVGASLSKYFLNKIVEVVLWSFLASSIVVLVVFRSLLPSFAVVFGAVADIFITAALMPWFGVPLTLASVAALLMLIGFSLDTDMLLTMRVTKRTEGTAHQRAFEAMKTGVLMNATAITSFGVLFLLSQFLQIDTYAHIGAVAVLGAFADFFATWCFNAVIILDYAEKKEAKTRA